MDHALVATGVAPRSPGFSQAKRSMRLAVFPPAFPPANGCDGPVCVPTIKQENTRRGVDARDRLLALTFSTKARRKRKHDDPTTNAESPDRVWLSDLRERWSRRRSDRLESDHAAIRCDPSPARPGCLISRWSMRRCTTPSRPLRGVSSHIAPQSRTLPGHPLRRLQRPRMASSSASSPAEQAALDMTYQNYPRPRVAE